MSTTTARMRQLDRADLPGYNGDPERGSMDYFRQQFGDATTKLGQTFGSMRGVFGVQERDPIDPIELYAFFAGNLQKEGELLGHQFIASSSRGYKPRGDESFAHFISQSYRGIRDATAQAEGSASFVYSGPDERRSVSPLRAGELVLQPDRSQLGGRAMASAIQYDAAVGLYLLHALADHASNTEFSRYSSQELVDIARSEGFKQRFTGDDITIGAVYTQLHRQMTELHLQAAQQVTGVDSLETDYHNIAAHLTVVPAEVADTTTSGTTTVPSGLGHSSADLRALLAAEGHDLSKFKKR